MSDETNERKANRRKASRFCFLVLGILSAITLLGILWICVSFLFAVLMPNTTAIGVIGGADGPTAIFVTMGPSVNARTVLLPVAGLLIAVYGLHKTKKR